MTDVDTAVFQARSETGDGPLWRALDALRKASGSSSSSSVGYDAILRPGVPSSGNAFATEAEVLAAIALIDAPRVGFDLQAVGGTYTLTLPWDMRRGSWVSTYPNTGVFEVVVPEGVQVTDLTWVQFGLGVRFVRTATPGLVYSPALYPPGVPRIFSVVEGSIVRNDATSTRAVIDVPAGETQVVSLNVGAVRSDAAASFVAMLGAGATTIAPLLQSSPLVNQGFGAGWVSGPAGSNLGYVSVDSTFVEPPVPSFLGTLVIEQLIERAAATSYDDSLPLLVPTPGITGATVQQAIDALKAQAGAQPITYLWVGPNGNDATAARGRIDKPFLTIQAALTAAVAGDTLMVAPGTYAESITIPDKDGLAIVGQDATTTIITSAAGPTLSWVPAPGASVRTFRLADVTVRNTDALSDGIVLDGTAVPSPATFLEICAFDRVIIEKTNGGQALSATCMGRLLMLLCTLDATAGALGLRLRNVSRFGATSSSFSAVNAGVPQLAVDAAWERNGGLPISGLGREGYYFANASYVLTNVGVSGQPIFSVDATSTLYAATTVIGSYYIPTAQGPVIRLNGSLGGAFDPGGGYLTPPVPGVGSVVITLPLTAAGAPKMIVDLTGAHVWGAFSVSKGGGGAVRQYCDARHATFYAETAGSISVGALCDLDLRKAAFAQAALVSVGGGAADRDVITITGAVLALGANAVAFAMPLPPSVTTGYQPVFVPTVVPAGPVSVAITGRTNTGFTATAVGVGATGDFTVQRAA